MNISLKSKTTLATNGNSETGKATTLVLADQGLRALLTGRPRARRHREPVHRHARPPNTTTMVQNEDNLNQRAGGACHPECLEKARETTAWLVRLNNPLSTWMSR